MPFLRASSNLGDVATLPPAPYLRLPFPPYLTPFLFPPGRHMPFLRTGSNQGDVATRAAGVMARAVKADGEEEAGAAAAAVVAVHGGAQ